MVGVDVVVQGFGGVSEMVVINVLGDTKEKEAVCEHISHVDNVLRSRISCSTVVLKYIIGFVYIFF